MLTELAISWILFLSLTLALTHPARIIIRVFFCSAALWSFLDKILVITSSNSNAICIFFSSVSPSDVAICTSIYRFTALLSPENEKLRESFSRSTSGKIHWNEPVYRAARSAIFFHPGNPSPIILATLSKHSPAASSCVWPIISRSNIDFQRYISVWPPETVRTTAGNTISDSVRSRKLANIWLSIWSILSIGFPIERASVSATTSPVKSDGARPGRSVQAIRSIWSRVIFASTSTSSIHGNIAFAWLRAATSGTTPPVASCSNCVRVESAIHWSSCITTTDVSSQDVSKARIYIWREYSEKWKFVNRRVFVEKQWEKNRIITLTFNVKFYERCLWWSF